MANRNLPVTGLDELEKFLSALPGNLRRNAINSGLRAAARVVTDEIKLRAPKQSGKMAASFGYSSPKRNQDGSISITVRPRNRKQGGNSHAFLAPLIEYGVAAHLIKISDEDAAGVETRLGPSRRGRSRKTVTGYANTMAKQGSLKIGETFVGPMVMHPGHAAHPFIRPALDAKAEDAVRAFVAQIGNWATGKLSGGPVFEEAA